MLSPVGWIRALSCDKPIFLTDFEILAMTHSVTTPPDQERSLGLFAIALHRLMRNRLAVACFLVIALYFVLIAGSSLGIIAVDWNREIAQSYAPPSFITPTKVIPAPNLSSIDPIEADKIDAMLNTLIQDPIGDAFNEAKNYSKANPSAPVTLLSSLPFGADRWGRDVIGKTLHGAQTSVFVGLGSALLATFIGVMLGALAGYLGGTVDALCDWLYSLFSSVPYLLLILAIAAVLEQSGIRTMIIIFGVTGWTGVYRLIRAETIRQRSREYVRAAQALGVPHWQRIVRHILPNTSHIILVQLSILTVGFIKSEVILSFLGFGVPVSEVSWGSMLNEAQNELLLGYWWQISAATVAMAILITAWSLFTDAMSDALDPKLK